MRFEIFHFYLASSVAGCLWAGQEFLMSLPCLDPCLHQIEPELFFLSTKWPECVDGFLSPSNSKVQNVWSLISTLYYVSMAWSLSARELLSLPSCCSMLLYNSNCIVLHEIASKICMLWYINTYNGLRLCVLYIGIECDCTIL
jgi:hypothetical protein